MKITRLGEKIGYIGKKTDEKMTMITLGEAYTLWKTLVFRYDALFETRTLINFVRDEDLKRIVNKGLQVLESQVSKLEHLCKEFAIPLPSRPPEDSAGKSDSNVFTDQTVYRKIYNGMADAMFKHVTNYQRCHSSYLREEFRKIMNEEMDLFDEFYEYGKLKAYLQEPPTYRS